jgi:SAM-dependent methyltransferase
VALTILNGCPAMAVAMHHHRDDRCTDMSHADLPASPAAERNKAPILDVLRRVLAPRAAVLEVASGTGQHAAHFAAANPLWRWQPTDADRRALPGIAARCAELENVGLPLELDVLRSRWPLEPAAFDALYCANLLHISPWDTCPALMAGAAHHLAPGGALLLYGPFFVDGEPVAPGNTAFDAGLRERDARWGLRRLVAVAAEGQRAGLAFEQRFEMPANNLLLLFRLGAGIA